MRRARELDPTRLAPLATVMGGPQDWMQECDVICMNCYWGWYVLGGEMDKALSSLEQELDHVWHAWQKPIIKTEFGAGTMPDQVDGGVAAASGVRRTRYSWSFSETDRFGIGETLVSRVQWSGGINFNGRQGHVTGELRLLDGAEIRTEFVNDAFHNTGALADTHVMTHPTSGFSTDTTMRGGSWPYFHGPKYHVTFQLHVWARGAHNPSTPDGSFISEHKQTPEFTCGPISSHTESCYSP